MKKVIGLVIQLSLFIAFSAAYAQMISHFTPLYVFSEPIREILFLVVAIGSSLLSVGLLKNVLGFTSK